MRSNIAYIFFFLILFACKNEQPQIEPVSSMNEKETAPIVQKAKPVRDTFNCEIFGKIDRTTDSWIAEEEYYFAMTNDIFQKIQPEVMRYNVFQVYNTLTCELRFNGKLRNKENLIRPYRLQGDIYNPITRLVCTQNPEEIYCYHMGFGEEVVPISPPISSKRQGKIDKEQPCDLDSWDNYLFGWTKSEGGYAFNMTNHRSPIALRYSESHYDGKAENYYFLLEQKSGKQLVRCEIVNDRIKLSTIFDQPLALRQQIVREQTAGRYLIFKYSDKLDFEVYDLVENKLISVPKKAKAGTASMRTYLKNV